MNLSDVSWVQSEISQSSVRAAGFYRSPHFRVLPGGVYDGGQ